MRKDFCLHLDLNFLGYNKTVRDQTVKKTN